MNKNFLKIGLIIAIFSLLSIYNPLQGAITYSNNQTQNLDSSNIPVTGSSNPTGDDWPMIHGNLNLNGSTTTSPTGGIAPLWSYNTSGAIDTNSPVVANGFVYVTNQNAKIFCINAISGSYVWNRTIGSGGAGAESTPAVADGFVYVGSDNGSFWCFYANNGTTKWVDTTYRPIAQAPTVANGVVYFIDDVSNLNILNATTGDEIIPYFSGGGMYGNSNCVVSGNYVYYGTDDAYTLECYNVATQSVEWDNSTDYSPYSPVLANGLIYVGDTGGDFYCFNATTGNNVWEISVGTSSPSIVSSPAIDNGKVFVTAEDGYIYCYGALNHTQLWENQLGTSSISSSSPAVANGMIYVGSGDQSLDCLNESTGDIIWNYTTSNYIDSSPAIAYGRVYVGCQNDNLYCFPMINCTTPSAPQNLQIIASNGTAVLNWSPSVNDGGSAITCYNIYRGTSSGNEILVANTSLVEFVDNGLTPGQTYFYTVSAVNAAGAGMKSNEVNSTITGPPDAPQNLQVSSGSSSILLKWDAPSANNGYSITGYKIYRGTSSGAETLLATVGNVLTYNDTNVTNGVNYYYKVSAINALGEGSPSFEKNVTYTHSSNNSSNTNKSIGGMGVGTTLFISSLGIIAIVAFMRKRQQLK